MMDTELFIVMAEHFKLDGGACFGVVPKAIWSKTCPPDENNLLPICARCLLVRDGNRLILIDTGIGDKQEGKFVEYLYLFGNDTLTGSLKKNGFYPEDITDVIFTHLHYDHCGGALRYSKDRLKFEPVFPNAVHWVSRKQWDWALYPNVREGASYLKENILPLKECTKLNFIEEETQFTPNIFLRLFNGHTAGQIIPHIKHRGKTIVFMADFIPTPFHLPLAYVPAYDTQPLLTMKEKENFLQTALKENYILFFEHDLTYEACTLEETEKGIRMKAGGKLADFIS